MSNKFDLKSISEQLPPNTGPPGTVQLYQNGNNFNNKNLSHVPCKFFKQGICQAGNSCPFSHNIDGNLAAGKIPCKYFQKGNCKFGLKCALAHFLPDGTRINNNNSNSNNNNKNNTISNKNYKTDTPDNNKFNYNTDRIHLFSNSYSSVFSNNPSPYPKITRSYSMNSSPPLFSEPFEDDEEEVESAENSIFEEDFLPNSLTDIILTPQEVERRDSRSQSGTLNVRPNFKLKEKISSDVFLMD
ncbi:unnamed protein product [Candida verbasci]|uniref:C3H1-type domain-containing protein n=1 Tax=Candida verbasci TaxID=1227364 RepID=A0A9W4XAE6_9ASCO|nr:unnamed protein product [Candida verbasci]